MQRLVLILCCLGLATVMIGGPAQAIRVISHASNATVYLGLPYEEMEFENPLPAGATSLSYYVREWLDADYSEGPPHWYDDWWVSDSVNIKGWPDQIWMDDQGQYIGTSTTVSKKYLSINLRGDFNDGLARVLVDDTEVAKLDMETPGYGYDHALVLVEFEEETCHTVEVHADGSARPNGPDNVMVYGAAVLEPLPQASLTYHERIADHYWYTTDDDPNEMISMWFSVAADATESVKWTSVDLYAWGSGDDFYDILSVKVWKDNNNNGIVDETTDTLLGSDCYPSDNGFLTLVFDNPPTVAPGGRIPALIAYRMDKNYAQAGSDYRFELVGAAAEGATSSAGIPVTIHPFPMQSALKTVAYGYEFPTSIGKAKKSSWIGKSVLFRDKVVTAYFHIGLFPSTMYYLYIEEADRSAGIGMMLTGPLSKIKIGDRVSLSGTLQLENQAELVVVPNEMSFQHGQPIGPVGMNNRGTGGGVFGLQPGLFDDDSVPRPAYGVNNVGMFIRAWGKVTGQGSVDIGGGTAVNVCWIDDGSKLYDGFTTSDQLPSCGVAVATGFGFGYQMVTGRCYEVTGIMKAMPNPSNRPVRLMFPTEVHMLNEPTN